MEAGRAGGSSETAAGAAMGASGDVDAGDVVRGRVVAKVRDDHSLDDATRRRILVTGLRALAGRDDLEAF